MEIYVYSRSYTLPRKNYVRTHKYTDKIADTLNYNTWLLALLHAEHTNKSHKEQKTEEGKK